jgi:hypothetical protein
MSLFTQAIELAQGAARGWPVAVVQRETEATHVSPGRMEVHLTCREPGRNGSCDQSVFRVWPVALDHADQPIAQEYTITPQMITDCVAAHVRQCHEDRLQA